MLHRIIRFYIMRVTELRHHRLFPLSLSLFLFYQPDNSDCFGNRCSVRRRMFLSEEII